MTGITTERILKQLTSDTLRSHLIIRVPERRNARLAVYLLNISNNGMIAEYRVRVGEFRVYVRVINLIRKTKLEGQSVGFGGFSKILEKRVANTKFVAKVQ
jgi:hypothetical protein